MRGLASRDPAGAGVPPFASSQPRAGINPVHPSLPPLRRVNVPRASGRSMDTGPEVAPAEADTPTFWAQERRRSSRVRPVPYLVEAVAHKSQI